MCGERDGGRRRCKRLRLAIVLARRQTRLHRCRRPASRLPVGRHTRAVRGTAAAASVAVVHAVVVRVCAAQRGGSTSFGRGNEKLLPRALLRLASPLAQRRLPVLRKETVTSSSPATGRAVVQTSEARSLVGEAGWPPRLAVHLQTPRSPSLALLHVALTPSLRVWSSASQRT